MKVKQDIYLKLIFIAKFKMSMKEATFIIFYFNYLIAFHNYLLSTVWYNWMKDKMENIITFLLGSRVWLIKTSTMESSVRELNEVASLDVI